MRGVLLETRWEFYASLVAQTGEHSYLIKLYNLIGGQKFEEDENSGGINVVDAPQQFAVSLDALFILRGYLG